MVEKRVKIEDVTYRGSGVARADGKVVFVRGADVGEEVVVDIQKSTSKFDVGRVVEVLEESPYRTCPHCAYLSVCEGCAFWHVTYERELEIKKNILQSELKKAGYFGKIDIEPSQNEIFYRNKLKLTYFDGEWGYISTLTHKRIPIKKCKLADESIITALKKVTTYLNSHRFSHLKNITFRSFDGGVMATFLFDKKEEFMLDDVLDFPVFLAIGEVLESDKTKIFKAFNQRDMCYTLLGEKFPVDAKSFLQVNKNVAEKLYEHVIMNVNGEKVVNAYSGQGVLTKLLAKKAKSVVGIEIQRSSCEIAEKIKAPNMKNINARVEDVLGDYLDADVVVLDPAREGCDEKVLREILSSNIKKVIYISCNFATLTRDLKALSKNYKIENVKLFDMFPRTASIEACVILEKI